MEEKKSVKISLSTFLLIIAIVIIVIMGVFIYKLYSNKAISTEKISSLNSQIENMEKQINNLEINNSEKQNTEISSSKDTPEKIQIPKSATNISEKEEKLISNYFQGIWITTNGKKLLAIDYGKRFCYINIAENNKEYGTYSVEYASSSSEPKITLSYTSGKTIEFKLSQGGTSYLIPNDGNEQYVKYEGYYFGTGEGDEGIFNN